MIFRKVKLMSMIVNLSCEEGYLMKPYCINQPIIVSGCREVTLDVSVF